MNVITRSRREAAAAGFALVAVLAVADVCEAGLFRRNRRPAPRVCLPPPRCCPAPGGVAGDPAPAGHDATGATATGGSPSGSTSNPPPTAAAAKPAMLDLDIPSGVKVTVDGRPAKGPEGRETFSAPAATGAQPHSFKVVVEFPAESKVPPLRLNYDAQPGATRSVDLKAAVAEWKKANDDLPDLTDKPNR